MTHRLTTNYAQNYCNRTLIVKVIVENVVTCFWGGHGVEQSAVMSVLFRSSKFRYTFEACQGHARSLFNKQMLIYHKQCGVRRRRVVEHQWELYYVLN